MSVIAKMNVSDEPRAFGDSTLVALQCVCENKLMPGCNDDAKEHENRSFQRASPSGTAQVHMPNGLNLQRGEELYLIFLEQEERPKFEGAIAWVSARVNSRTEYGGTSEQFEVSNTYRDYRAPKEDERQVTSFNLRMMVDNPAAAIQFKAGKAGYWIGLYRCRDFTIDQALSMAHE